MIRHADVRHVHVPDKSQQRANWNEVERFSRAVSDNPFCMGATGTPGVIALGAPGALSAVTWTSPSNPLYDQYHMINAADLTTLRIPMDGNYHLLTNWVTDSPAAATEIEARWELAPTSNSGFAAPVFTVAGPLATKSIPATPVLDNRFQHLWFGVELHKDDLLRYRVRINGGANFTTTTVVFSEFQFIAPIPVGR